MSLSKLDEIFLESLWIKRMVIRGKICYSNIRTNGMRIIHF